ncbi:DUF1127 domain-containing protein [uncultured Roseibium sp.]|uniref:DUF1127 domain-containing protein n=1 Tax=uncultured Roseibium sp. TaxID=1936171 RepID=UPI002608B96E|nr:DUF1127 domain-containing protein [uncultured Roseibium sp.]
MPEAKPSGSRLAAWRADFHAWRQKRRDRNELENLSSSTLRDLAIDRSEITSIVTSGEGERRRNRGD